MSKTLKRASIVIATLALSVGLCLGLAACGGSATNNNDEQMIRSQLDEAFATLKNPTADSINTMLGNDSSTLEQLEQFGVDPVEMLKHFFGKFDYSIGDVSVDGDKGVATVTVTNVDFQTVVNDFMANMASDEELMAQATQIITSGGSQDDLYPLIFEKLFTEIDASDKLVTNTADIELEKKDGVWDFSDAGQQELMSLMYGGFDFSTL